MPKQKSNALVVYSAGEGQCESVKPPLMKQELAKMIADVTRQKKKQNKKADKQSNVVIPGYARLMADPLNAPLCRKPDTNSSPSNVYRLVEVFDVQTTTQGCVANAFTSGLASSNYLAPTYAGTTISGIGPGTNSSYYNGLSADNSLFRPLAMVVQWMPTTNDNTSQGAVHLGLHPGAIAASGIVLGDISSYMDDSNGVMCAAESACAIVARPQVALGMYALTSTIGTLFPTVLLAVSGGPITSFIGKVTVTRVVECVPITGSIPAMTAQRSSSDPLTVAVAESVISPTATFSIGDNAYAAIVKSGNALAQAATADFENWSGANATSRVRRLLATA